jgi:hypothetical protein
MPRTCTLCTHPDRDAIDATLLEGATYRDVAGRFGVSKSAVERHKGDHLAAAIVKAHDSAEATHGDGLLAKVGELSKRAEAMYAEAERILRRALRERDHDTALEAIRTATSTMREARGTLELLVKVYVAAGEMLSRQDAELLVDQVHDIVRRHVVDREVLGAIARDVAQLRTGQAFTRGIS